MFVMTDAKEKIKHAATIIHGAQMRDPFYQFQGASEDNIILISPESSKEGTSTTFKIVTDLIGDGVSGNQDLSENRDELNFVPFTVKGDVIANSHKSPIKKILDRSNADIWRKEKAKALEKWIFRKTVRHKFFAFSANCTNVVWGGNKANAAAMAAGDKFDTTMLDEMLSRAKNGWTDAGGVEHPELVPFTIEKKTENGIEVVGEYFPIFVGPKSMLSLGDDPVFKAEQQAKATAGLFSGLSGFAGAYKGAVIIEVGTDSARRPGIIRSDNAGYGKYTGFDTYKAGDNTVTEVNFMLGCGAGAMPFDPEPTYDEDPTEDNNRKVVAYIEQYFGFEKVRWFGETDAEKASIYHNKDYGVIAGVATIS
ncbi:MAG: DUF4043 family protein [Sulfurovaceae bacterium]|nr:DUF4043 family protein [Sulfurovaceae bacterium]MDD5548859.1 DUF4043 family protein [Sulfurovaceae bacterium]